MGARLPNPVATHWGLSGDPDGSSLLAWFIAAPFAWAAMCFAAAIGALVLTANAGAATWRVAGSVSLPMALIPMLAGGIGAAIACAPERGRPLRAGDSDGARPPRGDATIGLRSGERAVWSARGPVRSCAGPRCRRAPSSRVGS